MAVYITGFLLALIGFIAGIMADHYLSPKSLPLETQDKLAPEKGAYIKGLKYKEIAQKMNISPKTVETMIYRGLKQLRNKLSPTVVGEKRNKTV